jgi:antitoxin FitA
MRGLKPSSRSTRGLEVCFTCDSVQHMSSMIQVRNVPDDVHRTLKARAAAAGMSLSDYIKRDLMAAASGPSLEEIDARVRARGPSRVRAQTIVSALREVRED